MYRTNGSSFSWVGLRGYAGGFDAIAVMDESERASTGPWGVMAVDMARDRNAPATGDQVGQSRIWLCRQNESWVSGQVNSRWDRRERAGLVNGLEPGME